MVHATLDDLQENWPGWKLWRTETMGMATRRTRKPDIPADFSTTRGDLAETLMEDGPRELLAALENQAGIEAEIEDRLDEASAARDGGRM